MATNRKSIKKKAEQEITFEIKRAHEFKDGGLTFDIVINGVSIYGCNVVAGKKGEFISFPSKKGKDGRYYSHAYIALTDEQQDEIINAVAEKLEDEE